jgi:hypothetical protein
MAGAGAGLGIMGGILGGVGDIISASNYERPSLPQPGQQEARLRQLAQNQLLGGGQQTLAGTALYNQMAPMLMGMLPGMHYVPGQTPEVGGNISDVGPQGGLDSYGEALAQLQAAQALQQQKTVQKAALKGMKKGPEKKAARQTFKDLKKTIKSQPSVQARERMQYTAGTRPNAELYNISQGPAASMSAAPSGDFGGMSLAAIRGMMDADQGTPNLAALYQGMGG